MARETAPISPATSERRILRRGEVEHRTGFKRSHLYNLIKAGEFPKAVRLGVRAVGWDSVEVEKWIADRVSQKQ